jgi:alginate O-acetyltransferase complex protein AlgI
LGFLCVFKYYNFFIQSFANFTETIGFAIYPKILNIILPVGISFYTFHGISYVVDIYNKKIEPEKLFINYALFVCYFPLLVAGPIERATHLLPQIKQQRKFNYAEAVLGMRQILWGLFKKMIIADNCAAIVNMLYSNYSNYTSYSLIIGAVLFSFQIYCDFSGYSDIALGVSRLFGIRLLKNFSFPYFSRNIAEFWRRWHISLSSWFRDYLYIPLGGSKVKTLKKVRNTFIIFIVSGFWHGANFTFIFWGFLNACYFLPSLLLNKNRNYIDTVAPNRKLPNAREIYSILTTFFLTTIAWIFFRAENMTHATNYILRIVTDLYNKNALIDALYFIKDNVGFTLIILIIFLLIIEWIGRMDNFALEKQGIPKNKFFRWIFYILVTCSIGLFSKTTETPFIYFQF